MVDTVTVEDVNAILFWVELLLAAAAAKNNTTIKILRRFIHNILYLQFFSVV